MMMAPSAAERSSPRYDFAVIIGKMLARMDKMKADREAPPPPEEMMLLDLVREFRQELQLLGIRVAGAERRVEKVEKQTRDLELRKSNIKMEGFYRLDQIHVAEVPNYTDYPFNFDLNRFRNVDEEGLSKLRQELFLRFLGTPYIKGAPHSDVEVFAELKGTLSGLASDALRYRFNEAPRVGDDEDSFATSVWDEKRVMLNRAHFNLRSKRGNVRVFANESITELKDPLILLSNNVYSPFMGVEGEGKYSKLSYFGSVLRRIDDEQSQGNNHRDLWDNFHELDDSWDIDFINEWENQDNFAARFTFEPYKGSQKYGDMSLVFGLTFNETIWSYDTEWDYNRVLALDVQYDRDYGRADLDSEISLLQSQGRGMTHDTGYQLDMAYRNQGLLATLKAYRFGKWYQMATAKSPFIDTDINYNFKRTPRFTLGPDTQGERLVRLQAKYDVPNSFLESLDDVTLSMLYETKSWERDPDNPRPSDFRHASRFYLQALADITDRTHFEYFTQVQKDVAREDVDPLPHEEGTATNEFKFDYRIRDNVALVTDLAFIDDFDAIDPEGGHFSLKRHTIELNSQVFPWMFLKGNTQYVKNSDLQLVHYADEMFEDVPRDLVNGRNIRRATGEIVLTSKSDLSLRANALWERITNKYWRFEDMYRKALVGEFGVNFTRALKMRYVHSIDWRDMKHDNEYEHIYDRVWVNGFLSIFYRPTENTEFEITYGDEYENPEDKLDNGSFNFFSTAKILQLKAQTAF
jgi:hypothetical protein